jgi:hypothetical protein
MEIVAVMGSQRDFGGSRFERKLHVFRGEDAFRRSLGSTGASRKDGVNVLVDSSVT